VSSHRFNPHPPPFLRGDDDAALVNPAEWMLRPDYINLDILKEIESLAESKTVVYIDNRKLDGFCEHFKKHDCRTTLCGEECNHCGRYAEKAVTINKESAATRLAHNRRILEMMVDRSAFSPEPFFKRVTIRTVKATNSAFIYGKKRLRKTKPA
jgi:hypothetical protein